MKTMFTKFAFPIIFEFCFMNAYNMLFPVNPKNKKQITILETIIVKNTHLFSKEALQLLTKQLKRRSL